MSELLAKRCQTHADREAAARCPECERFFCRECITEHDGRMTCRQCLQKLTEKNDEKKYQWLNGLGECFLRCCLVLIAVVMIYLYFFNRADEVLIEKIDNYQEEFHGRGRTFF